MAPSSLKFSINAMSKEKMEFNFPAVFTLGPKNNQESLTKFSRYLLGQDNEALIRRMELEKEVEIRRSLMEIEKQRATDFSTVQVKAEIEGKKAEGDSNSKRIMADANLYTKQKEADANLYAKRAEAEGIEALYRAQAEGLNKLVGSFSGNTQALISYTMLEKGIYENIAKSNADAIKGLNPKITVWTNDPNKAFDTVQNLGKSIIPMLDIIQDQTNYKLPDWLIQQQKSIEKKD